MDRSLTIERPVMVLAPPSIVTVGFTKLPLASLWPTRCSVNWPAEPATPLLWHSTHAVALKTGPNPLLGSCLRSNCAWSRAKVSPGGSAIPLLMLCEPGLAVVSPVGLMDCPSVGVVKPAGASVATCCATRAIAAAPIVIKEKAIFLCVNGCSLLKAGGVCFYGFPQELGKGV